VTRTRARYLLIAGAMIAGAWTLVAVVSTGQWYFFRLTSGRPAPWPSALADNLVSCWLWALFTPAIVWLARRHPVERGRLIGSVPRHLLLAGGLAAVDVLADLALAPWLSGGPDLPFLTAFFGKSFINLFSYAAVVAVTGRPGLHRRRLRLHLARVHRLRQVSHHLAEEPQRELEVRAGRWQQQPATRVLSSHGLGRSDPGGRLAV
jgi:hypothetical protein